MGTDRDSQIRSIIKELMIILIGSIYGLCDSVVLTKYAKSLENAHIFRNLVLGPRLTYS